MMKKLVDFQKDYNTVTVVVTSVEQFEQLKADNPECDFGKLENYMDHREKRKSSKPYVFNINNCKAAIEIVSETEKAYRIQTSHISGHNSGQPNSRHFKWVAKSLCQIIDGVLYYPRFI